MKKLYQIFLACLITGILTGMGSLNAQTGITGSVTTQPCNNNGVLSVTVTGLTAPVSYTYSNFISNQTIIHANINSLTNNLTNIPGYQQLVSWNNPNIWNVTASDGVNTVSGNFTITPAFQDSIKSIPGVCPNPSTLQAINFVGGTAPFSCVWTNVNTNVTFNTNPAMVPSGNYTVQITDAAGCVVSSAPGFTSNIYVQNISNINFTITGAAANCTNGAASVSAPSGGTPPYTYLWSNGAVSQNISGLTTGQYNCVVTDALGCQNTGWYFVNQVVNINYNSTVNNATCVQANGSVTSFVNGGTSPYSFLWSNGATTQNLSNVPSGSYNLQITDAVGCLGSGWVYVGASTPISVTNTVTASSCTAATGSATITATGGVGPYTVLWYTFPTNSTGISISNKPPGNYQFKVTASNGCIQTGSALIPPVSSIVAGALGNSPVCPVTTGNVQTFVSGSNPPFSYAWSTGATTSSITGVGLGYYSCTITDALGCSKTVGGSVAQTSPINIGFSATPATCIFSNNGSLFAAASGGLPPYTYNWGTQTGQTASGLGVGDHWVLVTDANGCSKSAFAFVGNSATSNSCFCTITGTVFTDTNANCVQNMGEAGLPNVQIYCSGIGYVYTDAAGAYSFMVPSGTYTISQSVQQMYPLATCQNNNIVVNVTAASNCLNVVNFANNIIPIHDLQIITSNINQPVPGNAYTQKVIIQNNGSITENNIKVGYRHDGQLTYNNNSNWAFTQPNTGVPSWLRINTGFSSLSPGGSSSTFLYYNVPTNIPLNTQVNSFDTVAYLAPIGTNWLVDNTPWTNVNAHQAYVIGSYDPNFKEVQPRGVGSQGDITKRDSVLTYIVHFQNTGSYFAQNIVVVDTLDANLNLKTMRPGYSDHKYTVTISDNGVAKFTFSNINLPWKSSYGDISSSGMFTYSIRLKSNLALGTKIRNKAAIYFDYNAPIITNTTLNTLVAPNAISELKAANTDRMLLYPNPANNEFTLVYSSSESIQAVISVIDINGRVVLSKTLNLIEGENTLSGNTSSLQSGVYFVQVKTTNDCYTKKLLISK